MTERDKIAIALAAWGLGPEERSVITVHDNHTGLPIVYPSEWICPLFELLEKSTDEPAKEFAHMLKLSNLGLWKWGITEDGEPYILPTGVTLNLELADFLPEPEGAENLGVIW
jgi:hypothetical protein